MNSGAPQGLAGSDYRYIRRPKRWALDDERGRRRIHWLTIATVFSYAFSALFLYVSSVYSVELWIVVSGIILLLFALVSSYAILHIKMHPSHGVFFKRFKLRPATVVAMVETAAKGCGMELREVPVRTTRWDLKRYWDTCRSYEIVGMESHVNVVRRFWVFFFWVFQYTYVDMGPKGMGEDEALDELASAIDAANLVGEEPTLVDLTDSGGEHKKGIVGMIIADIVWLVLIIQGLGFHFGWYVTGVSGPLPFDQVTLLMILMAVLALMMWAQGRMISAAREVTSPGAYGVTAGGS